MRNTNSGSRSVSMLAMTALFCTAAGCGAKTSTQAMPTATIETPPARVTVVRGERKMIRRTVVQPGQIEAFELAKMYAKVPAYVEKYFVDIGDVVYGPQFDDQGKVTKRGQLLAELSAPELDQELRQKDALVIQAGADVEQTQADVKVAQAESASAAARLAEAVAAVDRVEADYQRWRSEYERVVQLVAKSAVTQKLADETKAQMQSADAARKEAAAKIESARFSVAASEALVDKRRADEAAMRARRNVAEAEQARVRALQSYLKIEAPFDGAIFERNAETGYFAQAGGGGQNQPLFTVVRTDRVRVFVDLPEMDAPLANAGDKAIVRVQALAGRDFTGAVTRTSWALDNETRTLHTEVDVPNEDGQLRPGMYAQVTIELAEHANALVLPAAAVVNQDGQTWCFVVADGKAVRKLVSIGLRSGGEVEIASGLSGDESVIVGKGASLTDGQNVEVAEPSTAK